jgi:uncharacterized protein YndB with AHSA1/START domain
MPPHSQARTGLEIDLANHTIRLVRSFDAPADLVFKAWTTPEHIRCWWDAAGKPLETCEIDLRAGGAFRFVSSDHPDRPFAGVYQEITPPCRLVFEALNSIGSVLFDTQDGKTRMTVEIACKSAEQLEQFLAVGVDVGTSQTLDNLVAYIQRQGVPA